MNACRAGLGHHVQVGCGRPDAVGERNAIVKQAALGEMGGQAGFEAPVGVLALVDRLQEVGMQAGPPVTAQQVSHHLQRFAAGPDRRERPDQQPHSRWPGGTSCRSSGYRRHNPRQRRGIPEWRGIGERRGVGERRGEGREGGGVGVRRKAGGGARVGFDRLPQGRRQRRQEFVVGRVDPRLLVGVAQRERHALAGLAIRLQPLANAVCVGIGWAGTVAMDNAGDPSPQLTDTRGQRREARAAAVRQQVQPTGHGSNAISGHPPAPANARRHGDER
jgi:hypothetical protein